MILFDRKKEACLTKKLQKIVSVHGPWTAHNLELSPGIFTIEKGARNRAGERAVLFDNIFSTYFRKPFLKKLGLKRLRVLDLGCLEGGISLHFAKNGADVVGIDVRPDHLAKAAFAAESLGLSKRCCWIEGDVTSEEVWSRLGRFDLVVCSGILYHLEASAIHKFLTNIFNHCFHGGVLVIDTNISATASEAFTLDDGFKIYGHHWIEHEEGKSLSERIKDPWSSYANCSAFWLTEISLINILIKSGFKTVLKQLYPYHMWGHQTRDIWVALAKGTSDMPLRKDPDDRPLLHPGLNK